MLVCKLNYSVPAEKIPRARQKMNRKIQQNEVHTFCFMYTIVYAYYRIL